MAANTGLTVFSLLSHTCEIRLRFVLRFEEGATEHSSHSSENYHNCTHVKSEGGITSGQNVHEKFYEAIPEIYDCELEEDLCLSCNKAVV